MVKTVYVSPTNIARKMRSLAKERAIIVKAYQNGKRETGGQIAIQYI